MNFWTIIGTVLGALIAGLSILLNSIYSSKSIQKREDRKRLIDEKDRDIKELESIYEKSLHLIDKLLRELGSLPSSELEEYYKLEIRLELISTEEINKEIKDIRGGIADMIKELPNIPEEFIPKFEDDFQRESRLKRKKSSEIKRKEKSKEFLPALRDKYRYISELMKKDLQQRRLLGIDEYIKYLKKN